MQGSGNNYGADGFNKEIEIDKFTGATSYSYAVKKIERYDKINNSIYFVVFVPVLTETKDSKKLACSILYHGKEWLFIQKIFVKINSDEPIDIPNKNLLRDISTKSGVNVNEAHGLLIRHDLFEKMANAQNVTFRISGKKGTYDVELMPEELNAMRWMLETYNSIPKQDILNK